jgi:DNA invertase Pin-like site-specific DNA recombinase
MSNKTESVAAYIRVSTQEQKLHGFSLDAQRQKLSEYAERNNLRISGWYEDEGISGRKPIKKRPALMRMASDAASGRFTRIIFIKLDRFFRSVPEYYEFMKLTHDIPWTATEEPIYDTTTATGRMNVNIKLSIAQLEAEQTSERIKAVNEYKVKSGQVVTGTVPWCFRIEVRDGRKVIVKNPETAHIMEDLLQYYIQHQSKRATLFYINEKYGLNIAHSNFSNLLRNEKICGCYRGNPNYCEAYIDRDTFEFIQSITDTKHIKHNSNEPYLFTGLLRCPVCGTRLAGFRAAYSSRTYKIDPVKYKYKKYRCSKHAKSGICSYTRTIAENVLERIVLERIEDELADALLARSRPDNSDKDRLYIERQKSAVQDEIDRLNYAWQKGRIDVDDYDRQYDVLIEKLNALSHSVNKPVRDLSKAVSVLSGNWKEVYSNLDAEHKQVFWRSFVDEIELVSWDVDDRRIRIHFL